MIDKDKAIEQRFQGCLGELILHLERSQSGGKVVVDIGSLNINLLRQFFGSGFEWGILFGGRAAALGKPSYGEV